MAVRADMADLLDLAGENVVPAGVSTMVSEVQFVSQGVSAVKTPESRFPLFFCSKNGVRAFEQACVQPNAWCFSCCRLVRELSVRF